MSTPVVSGQDLGRAERATRAVLERLLATTGTTFLQWMVLNVAGTAARGVNEEQLVTRVVDALRTREPLVLSAVDELVRDGLLTISAEGHASLTEAGEARYRLGRSGIDRIAERFTRDLPADDLAAARRVLAIVTERPNATLAE